MTAMRAGEGEKGFFELKGVAAFRAKRLAEAPRGWQHIRQVIDYYANYEPQDCTQKDRKNTRAGDRFQAN